jgi:hypothetical protein
MNIDDAINVLRDLKSIGTTDLAMDVVTVWDLDRIWGVKIRDLQLRIIDALESRNDASLGMTPKAIKKLKEGIR